MQEADNNRPRTLPRVAKQPQDEEEKTAVPAQKVKPFTSVVRMQRPEVQTDISYTFKKYIPLFLATSALVFKAIVDLSLVCFLSACSRFVRFISRAIPADLLVSRSVLVASYLFEWRLMMIMVDIGGPFLSL